MNEKEMKETKVWVLYQKSVAYGRKHNYFSDVDRNNNFFNGDQWEGLLIEGIEPVQYNFIKPIVNYKVNKITKNLRAINYSADNVNGTEFRNKAKQVCDLFNQRAARVWEKDQMDLKVKRMIRSAAINSESIMYVSYDEETGDPKNELLNKLDVFYSNENDSDIQNQSYILIKKRVSLYEAQEIAKQYGVSENEIEQILGDEDTTDEAGTDAKDEVDNMVTLVYKFFKTKEGIHYDLASKYVEFALDKNMGTNLYPLAHTLWSDKEGSARGEGEVRTLIPNQIETNKTAMRRLLTAKNTAYPQKIYNRTKVVNPEAIDSVGGIIEVEGMEIDDVKKVFNTTTPAQMSPDVEKLQNELISTTRELANASDTATGQVNPEDASGRAILAVQQASEQPLDEQNVMLNNCLEDIAKIWLDMWKTHNEDGITLEDLKTDINTGEEYITEVKVDKTTLDELRTSVKIDITPKGSYDKYAQEVSLENLAKTEQFMNTKWLEDYVSLLDNDAVMPKLKLEDLIKRRKENEQKIRAIEEQGALMQQRVSQMMNSGQIMPKEMQPYLQESQEPQLEEEMVEEY